MTRVRPMATGRIPAFFRPADETAVRETHGPLAGAQPFHPWAHTGRRSYPAYPPPRYRPARGCLGSRAAWAGQNGGLWVPGQPDPANM